MSAPQRDGSPGEVRADNRCHCGRRFRRIPLKSGPGWVTGCPEHVPEHMEAFEALAKAAVEAYARGGLTVRRPTTEANHG